MQMADGKWRPTVAHRVAYELYIGPIPDGLVVDHLCHTEDLDCPGAKHCPHEVRRPDARGGGAQAENNRRGRSPVARMLRDEVCHKGHPFVGDNILMRRTGKRECRSECVHIRDRARNKTPERLEQFRQLYRDRKAAERASR